MNIYPVNSLTHARLYQRNYAPSGIDSSFKIDEGYSEDTRSLDDVDSPMKLEPGVNETNGVSMPMAASSLSDGVMVLNEAERSGMLPRDPHPSIPHCAKCLAIDHAQILFTMFYEPYEHRLSQLSWND